MSPPQDASKVLGLNAPALRESLQRPRQPLIAVHQQVEARRTSPERYQSTASERPSASALSSANLPKSPTSPA
jgi:hypothetical protein